MPLNEEGVAVSGEAVEAESLASGQFDVYRPHGAAEVVSFFEVVFKGVIDCHIGLVSEEGETQLPGELGGSAQEHGGSFRTVFLDAHDIRL